MLLLPSFARCLLPSAYCLLPTAYCLLPTAFRLLTSSLRVLQRKVQLTNALAQTSDRLFAVRVWRRKHSLDTRYVIKRTADMSLGDPPLLGGFDHCLPSPRCSVR